MIELLAKTHRQKIILELAKVAQPMRAFQIHEKLKSKKTVHATHNALERLVKHGYIEKKGEFYFLSNQYIESVEELALLLKKCSKRWSE